jgi:hypothetical protein
MFQQYHKISFKFRQENVVLQNCCSLKRILIVQYHVLFCGRRRYRGHIIILTRLSCAMVHAFARWPLSTDAQFESQLIPCGICGGQSDMEMILYPSTLTFCSQYHSTNASYSFTRSEKEWRYGTIRPYLCGRVSVWNFNKLSNCRLILRVAGCLARQYLIIYILFRYWV